MFNAGIASLHAAVAVAIVAAPSIIMAQTPGPDAIVGTWQAEDNSAMFEIFNAGGTYAARVIRNNRLVEADGQTFRRDEKNPDPALRSRSLKGIVFLKDLQWDAADQRWEGGSVYDPVSGRTASARLSLDGAKLSMRAYMGTPMLGRTVHFRRVAR
ncbi:DUF2147 domain-containing protein [Sphingomonas sp.]|uniref:DUF2147 domain-containing protein n=1 Tax=Sphingomonas sp. TaxID=28214 RepID=UPI002BE8DC92|nr:DUF2147 domain-containing protein [Sphingomonas sp.]HTG37658.1 DUF2147 domain-containing protein [Sphingomonas sp.]